MVDDYASLFNEWVGAWYFVFGFVRRGSNSSFL